MFHPYFMCLLYDKYKYPGIKKSPALSKNETKKKFIKGSYKFFIINKNEEKI